jgi:hypothetical protein
VSACTTFAAKLRVYLYMMQNKGSGDSAAASFTGKGIPGGSAAIFTFDLNKTSEPIAPGALAPGALRICSSGLKGAVSQRLVSCIVGCY